MNLKKFDLNLLVVFSALDRKRSVSQAAEELSVTQPTVSAALARLRNYFNDSLFVWNGREMYPTPKAEQLAPTIRRILESSEQLISDGRFDSLAVGRRMQFAVVDFIAAYLMPGLEQRMCQQAVNVDLHLIDLNRAMLNKSNVDMFDLYFVPEQAVPNADVHFRPLLQDDVVVIARKDHPAIREPITLEKYLTARQVIFSADSRSIVNIQIDRVLALGHTLRTPIIVNGFAGIPELVARTDLISTVPWMSVAGSKWLEHLSVFTPPFEVPPYRGGIFWSKAFDDDVLHRWMREALIETALQAFAAVTPFRRKDAVGSAAGA